MKKLLITATLLLLLSLKPLFAGVAKGVDVREVQTILTELCFNVGPIDGVWGKKTEKAAEEFFTKYFTKYGGYFGHMELKMLQASNRADAVGGKQLKRCSPSLQKGKKYRKGSLDLEGRLAELSKKGVLRSKCRKGWVNPNSKPVVIKTLKTEKKNYGGRDPRITEFSNLIIDLTAACFAGSKSACNSGIESLRQYAELGSPFEENQAKFSGAIRTQNTFGMNQTFISPSINFLSVYDQQIGLTKQELDSFDKWLNTLVKRYRKKLCKKNKPVEYREHGHRKPWSTQNHCISSSISSAALGSWLDDKKLLDEGVKQWKKTLGTMRKDGSLPHETSRGSKAMSYTGATLTVLVRLAEILRQNGIDLYGLDVNGKSIHDNVNFYLNVVENPNLIHEYARFNVNSGGSIPYTEQEADGIYSVQYAWIAPYMLRFPNHPNTKRLKSLSGKENKHTQTVSTIVKRGYGGSFGLDADPNCFYSQP